MTIIGLFVLAIIAVSITGVAFLQVRRKRTAKWNNVFEETARRLRFHFTKGDFFKYPTLSGRSGVMNMRLNLVRCRTVLAISYAVNFPALKAELAEAIEIFLHLTNRLTDDPDGDFVLRPDPHASFALLHPEARDIISTLASYAVGQAFALSRSTLFTKQRASFPTDPLGLIQEIKSIIRLITLLQRPGSAKEILRENYWAESGAEARAAGLQAYAAVIGRLSLTDKIVHNALDSHDPRLVFQAVKTVGEPVQERLPDLLQRADENLALEIVEYAAQNKLIFLVPSFITACETVTGLSLKEALLAFITESDDPLVEDFLRKELYPERHWPVEYQHECLALLGERGGVESLKFLHSLKDDVSRREINTAMAAIRHRLGAGTEGALSLAEQGAAGGNLSLAGKQASRKRVSQAESRKDKKAPQAKNLRVTRKKKSNNTKKG